MTRLLAARGLALVAVVSLLAACAGPTPSPNPACPTQPPTEANAADIIGDTAALEVRTNKGNFTIELDPSSAPIAVANLVALADCGFYDGQSFHRVVPGFVAQAGDPQTKANHGDFEGLGSGGPGYQFDIEFPPESTSYTKYMVAMANAMQYDPNTGEISGGTDTNGSQFFVMLDDADFLRPYYSLLGEVVAGLEVVDAIGQVPTNGDPMNVPLDPVIIDEIVPGAVPQAS
ncbi:MAG TPA: peptidylprolyl isomerase [Candidatus Limnocylindria bacterium]|nr:peptidylprolyl isomerase [Candidatus Limnocylindria bacterium]